MRAGCEVVDGIWDGERLAGVRYEGGEEGGGEVRAERRRPLQRRLVGGGAVAAGGGAAAGAAGQGRGAGAAHAPGHEPPASRILASERVYLVPRRTAG